MKAPVPESSFKSNCKHPACNHIKKETLTQMVSCEFYEISENLIFLEHFLAALFLREFQITEYADDL